MTKQTFNTPTKQSEIILTPPPIKRQYGFHYKSFNSTPRKLYFNPDPSELPIPSIKLLTPKNMNF
jgi:hypothetical protein